MKRAFLTWLAVVSSCLPSFSQLVLAPGQVWDYSFDTLPKTGSVSVFGNNPAGTLQFTVNNASFQPGDMLRYDMFENNTTETPICSGLMSSAPPYDQSCSSDFSWQDRQGAIRFSMLAGSVTIDSITLKAVVAGPSLSSYDVYSTTFTPVPEPGSMTLLGVGAILAMLWSRQQRRP